MNCEHPHIAQIFWITTVDKGDTKHNGKYCRACGKAKRKELKEEGIESTVKPLIG